MKRRLLAVSWFLLALVAVSAQASEENRGLRQAALQTPRAQTAVMMDVARAGDRLVAVGERGVILLSDDHGRQWRQVPVPVSVGLTAVQFVDARQGWAVGHAGVVLHSNDGGESWAVQLDGYRAAQLALQEVQTEGAAASPRQLADARLLVADGADKPLLAMHFSDAQHGIVVGAYGLALRTDDGGANWHSWMTHLPNPRGAHLYAIAASGANLYLAGEQGLFLRSEDRGSTFAAVETPYQGTYFTLAALPSGVLLVGGLQGTLLRSEDAGRSFQTLSNPLPVSLSVIRQFGGRVLALNQDGGLLDIQADGLAPRPLPNPAMLKLTSFVEAADGSLAAAGLSGAARLETTFLKSSE